MSKLMLRIAAGSALGLVGVVAATVVFSLLTQEKEKDPTIKEGWENDNPKEGGNTGGREFTLIPNYNTAVVKPLPYFSWMNNVTYPENIDLTYIGEYGAEDDPVICIFDTNFLIDYYDNTDFINLLGYIDSNTLKIIPKTVMAELDRMKKDSSNRSERAFSVRRVIELLSKMPKGALVADKTFSENKADDAILDSIKHIANQYKDFKVYVFTSDKLFTSKINQENMDNVEVASHIGGNIFYF